MHSLLCQAIRRRQLLMFGYGDSVRVVEPHMYGVNTAGNQALSAWLRAGYSRSQPDGGWRMFLTEYMREVQTLDDTFDGPRAGFNPRDPHMVEVYCRVHAGAAADAPAAGARAAGPANGDAAESPSAPSAEPGLRPSPEGDRPDIR
ncbi:MAG TPA: hypothetical protein VNA89_14200 [Gemmatimonadaceae bacterium]|nr:hypothetical protein [Gemmatimonadaceae bacterium]